MRRNHSWPGWVRLLSPLFLLLLWQAASHVGWLPGTVLAAPSQILAAGSALTLSGELPQALLVSAARVAAGFALAVLFGVALALVSGLSRLGEAVFDPPMQMLKAMPFLGLLPLFILWFGIGEAPKIGLVTLGAVFPIYLTLFAGIRGVDPKLVEAGRSLELSQLQVVRHIILPGALPSLMVGMRYGLSLGWLSLVVGEQINAQSGLGALITRARDFLQTDIIVVCLLVYALMGLGTDALVRLAEAWALRWRGPA
ncbi:ABC transporter permease [Teichococcus vastitatis]|uniref:ABC transporter permease n=1 Tax=Teichococcus vastitatis TaxID=2307076 RepID=UPI000E71EDE8|nr:ABC transporter permease [Pseudoroseomonas vastitatis]